MKLPNLENAVVAQAKVVEYLLSATHRKGKSKALFFTHFGFSVVRWEELAAALLQHALEHSVITTRTTLYGINYVMEGDLQTPDGRRPQLRAVWCLRQADPIPYLVTAYPLDEQDI